MECEIPTAVNCLFEDDFDLFGGSDRPALMNLIEEYFCREDPDGMSSGKRNSSDQCVKATMNFTIVPYYLDDDDELMDDGITTEDQTNGLFSSNSNTKDSVQLL